VTACRRFEPLLEAWVAGTLAPAARRQAEEHLAACPACRELADLARLTADAPDLTATVLAATTGPACARAEDHLPAWLASDLEETDHDLVTLHLETCPDCRALADILLTLDATLPNLREMTPPVGFTQEVLHTLRALEPQAPSPKPGRVGVPVPPFDVRLSTWLRTAWPRLVQRPRFATELAYALTVVAVLAVQATGALAGAEPRELLERAREGTAEQVQALAEAPAVTGTAVTARRLGDRVGDFVGTVKDTAGTFLRDTASSLLNEDEPDSSTPTEETP
jgi:hypothetical protein